VYLETLGAFMCVVALQVDQIASVASFLKRNLQN